MFETSNMVYFTCLEKGIRVNPVLASFSIGRFPIEIRWYGFLIAMGFLLAVFFGIHMARKWKINIDKLIDVIIVGTIGGILGARIYYVACEWESYKDYPAEIFAVWNGGLAIYGGIIGAVLVGLIACKVKKINFLNVFDIVVMGFFIGQSIGRWGNFANQEAFGSNTTLPWGMKSERTFMYLLMNQNGLAERGITVDPSMPVHPTFLYESIWCALGFLVLYVIYKKFRKFSGQLALCYGIWYGIGRTIIEGFRTDSLYIWSTNIRISQALSVALVVVCAVVLIVNLVKIKKTPRLIEGVDYFPLETQLEKPPKTKEEIRLEREQKKQAKQEKKNK